MKIHVNDPTAAAELLDALTAADCIAERAEDGVLEVDVPWAGDGDDEHQAVIELSFFVKAWEARRPGLVAFVSA